MVGSMVYRLPADAPEEPHMARFISAMSIAEGLSDNRGYNHVAGFHGAPYWYCWHHQASRRTQLQARLFLPWHRAYLYLLEQTLQDQVPGTSLPWWDWGATQRVPSAYARAGLDGGRNPLYGTRARVPSASPPINRRTRRSPGRIPGSRLPTTAETRELLDDPDWASFSDRLEDLHDNVHGWVGGDMQDVTTAAYDPLFFAHHCMIDRVWYLWQVRHGNGGIPLELLDLPLIPFGQTFADVLSTQRLGYEYATAATNIAIAGNNG